MWLVLRTGQPYLTDHPLDVKMDWYSMLYEDNDFAPIFALLESEEERQQTRSGSQLGRPRSVDRNLAAGAIQLYQNYTDGNST